MASITAEELSVRYPVLTAGARSLKHHLLARTTGGRISGSSAGYVEVQALDNVSFAFDSGDRVALIGHNGSGKSTLLRVLAGIYHPTSGAVQVSGRIAALFDTAFGMDPDSTGYENIILRGLYLGVGRREIETRVDEIATFTELGGFLDMPLRTYSAGMAARLAFGISTAVSADILLIDEGVGAGDAAFLNKANERLEHFIKQSKILVLASHDEQTMQRFCNKGAVFQKGQLVFLGDILDAYRHYAEIVGASTV
jgi:ABC-2 type transport system ATP-binding protein/lipopolysaccharide transport system ATP-binding protein